MDIVIIEDEQFAAESLERLILELRPDANIMASLGSVEDAIEWFETNPSADLIFSDIQLSDGNSFEIFRTIDIHCPVIFTTAFDEYAIEAFKVNSIDYLLKPIQKKEMGKAVKKFEDLHQNQLSQELDNFKKLLSNTGGDVSSHRKRSRFLSKSGQSLMSIPVEDVAYFYAEEGVVFLYDLKGKRFLVNYTLEELTAQTDSNLFFRINRQFLVHINAIKELHPYFKGRLLVELNPGFEEKIVVSAGKAKSFKEWLDQ